MLPFPAPEGPDGKLWHFERLCMHARWFANVPNCPGGNTKRIDGTAGSTQSRRPQDHRVKVMVTGDLKKRTFPLFWNDPG